MFAKLLGCLYGYAKLDRIKTSFAEGLFHGACAECKGEYLERKIFGVVMKAAAFILKELNASFVLKSRGGSTACRELPH